MLFRSQVRRLLPRVGYRRGDVRILELARATVRFLSFLLCLYAHPATSSRRRHRVFAELLEQGTRSTLKIPSPYPSPAPSAAAMAAQALEATQMGLDAMRVLGLNPNQALQHPGFYYYMAARCTERRRERFLSALDGDSEGGQQSNAPGFVNERKVDHLTIVLEASLVSFGRRARVADALVRFRSCTRAHTSCSRSGAPSSRATTPAA